MQYNTIRYDTIRYDTIRCDTMRCDAMRRDAMRCDTIQHNIIQVFFSQNDRHDFTYMRFKILNIGKGESRSIILTKCFPLNINYYLMHDVINLKLFIILCIIVKAINVS